MNQCVSEEKVVLTKIDLVELSSREIVSSIRLSEGFLIVGYQSGLVQIFDISQIDEDSGELGSEISRLHTGGEILDAWIRNESKTLTIVSNSTSFPSGERARRMEVWQF